jgi:hypothetical protein
MADIFQSNVLVTLKLPPNDVLKRSVVPFVLLVEYGF